jgi:16S rRNA (cytosine1402-N4)-methyltransferase
MTAFAHTPVLLEEVLTLLELAPGMTVADVTVGGGGHAAALARAIGPTGRLIAVDRDPEALAAARLALADAPCRVEFHHGNFADLTAWVAPATLDAALADLGVSSPQVDRPERGFTYREDGPLDMRMDPTSPGPTAREVVNGLPEAELAHILHLYGEERFARRIARHIAAARARRPIETTLELAEIVKDAIPAPARRHGPHPARRTFQALRIYVNAELDALERLLDALATCLRPGGRAAVISFHSLEDRIVKHRFRSSPWQPVTRRPVTPSAAEIANNPRARSAKLRVARVLAQAEGE